MKEEKLRGSIAMDLEIANVNWTVSKWIKWTLQNKVGLILEDGRVVGWDTKPERFKK